jgi:hypothetical protein
LLGSCNDRRDAMKIPGVFQVAGTADRQNIADFEIAEFPGSTAFIPHFLSDRFISMLRDVRSAQ